MSSECNSSPKRHYLLDIALSPAGFFMAGCMFVPPILELILPMDKPLPLGTEYWFAIPVCLWVSVGMAVAIYTHSDKNAVKELSKMDTWAASWYLINGCFFTSMMDVFAGYFQR